MGAKCQTNISCLSHLREALSHLLQNDTGVLGFCSWASSVPHHSLSSLAALPLQQAQDTAGLD